MARDKGRQVRLFAIAEPVAFPTVRELVYLSSGGAVDNRPDRVVAWDIRVKTHVVVNSELGGGTRPGDRRWGRRLCNHTSRGNSTPRSGRGDKEGSVCTL